MDHFAIDLGSRESQVCVRDEKGQIVLERRVLTRILPTLMRKQAPCRVVMETCAEAFGVADAALEMGHQVRVVPATLVRALGVGARGIKTDIRDARVLSEASVRIDLPSVHVPTMSSRDGKAMCNMRDVLVKARTMLINAERGYLRTKAIKVIRGDSETFPTRLEKTLVKLATKEPSSTKVSATPASAAPPASAIKKGSSKGRKAAKASSDAQPSSTTPAATKFPSGLSASGALPVFADRVVCAVGQLTEWIEQADQELAERVAPDPICQRLMTIPGVGPVCSTRFVTTLDTVERFATVAQLQSYLGLVPGEHQSGDKQRRTKTIKCGAAQARSALVQSAWCLYRTRKTDPIVVWALEVEKRRGRKIAIGALARKLAAVMFVIWRDGTTYNPFHATHKNSKQSEVSSTD